MTMNKVFTLNTQTHSHAHIYTICMYVYLHNLEWNVTHADATAYV